MATNTHKDSYAAKKIRSLRALNVKNFELGNSITMERIECMIDELPRLQEMNQSLCNSRRPSEDLVKDVNNFQVPAIKDKHIVDIMKGKELDH